MYVRNYCIIERAPSNCTSIYRGWRAWRWQFSQSGVIPAQPVANNRFLVAFWSVTTSIPESHPEVIPKFRFPKEQHLRWICGYRLFIWEVTLGNSNEARESKSQYRSCCWGSCFCQNFPECFPEQTSWKIRVFICWLPSLVGWGIPKAADSRDFVVLLPSLASSYRRQRTS